MTKRKDHRKVYTREFKLQALEIAETSEKSVAQIEDDERRLFEILVTDNNRLEQEQLITKGALRPLGFREKANTNKTN
jgi:hypothetical protein